MLDLIVKTNNTLLKWLYIFWVLKNQERQPDVLRE